MSKNSFFKFFLVLGASIALSHSCVASQNYDESEDLNTNDSSLSPHAQKLLQELTQELGYHAMNTKRLEQAKEILIQTENDIGDALDIIEAAEQEQGDENFTSQDNEEEIPQENLENKKSKTIEKKTIPLPTKEKKKKEKKQEDVQDVNDENEDEDTSNSSTFNVKDLFKNTTKKSKTIEKKTIPLPTKEKQKERNDEELNSKKDKKKTEPTRVYKHFSPKN